MKPPTLSPLAYRRLCLVAVVALAAIVVTGGAVRLTGSGLGCSTWPQCEPGSYTSAIAFRPLVEFGNRMVTIAVGVITAAVAGGSLLLRPRRRDLVWLAWGLVLGYVAQAVLGGLTVLYKLSPLLVMGHFLVSMLLLWDAIVLHRRAGQRAGTRPRSAVGPHSVGGHRGAGGGGLRPVLPAPAQWPGRVARRWRHRLLGGHALLLPRPLRPGAGDGRRAGGRRAVAGRTAGVRLPVRR